ncbi:MAG TPA: hypothetical protein VER36_12320 [Flavisolibacter sp.]|nr:hypothetical protein [Flavisolibacter sp.]
MLRKVLLTITLVCLLHLCHAQKQKDTPSFDTSFIDYDDLFAELEAFIDSLSAPKSFAILNVTVGQSFFTYQPDAKTTEARKQFIYAPSVGYFDKSGFGVSAGASVINDGTGLNPYQFSLAGSYDYQKNKAFITGLAFTHYITKDALPFYTSPLQNELYAYFTHRKSWFKPSVGLSYGWGSREDFEEREEKIKGIKLARRGVTRITTTESVSDFSLLTSIRHDFYFREKLASDYIRITPQISFVTGTQQFGFNQTANTYVTVRRTGQNVLYATENMAMDDQLNFQPVSLTGFIKAEYAKRKIYVQPQLIFDYYFPASSNNFSTAFIINAGLLF